MDKMPRPETFSIVYCTLWPLYSGNLPISNYRHRNHAPVDKINTNFPLKADLHVLVLKSFTVLEYFSCFYPSYNGFKASLHSSSAKLSNTWCTATEKGCQITSCTLCIKDTSLLWPIQRGPAVSTIQGFLFFVFLASTMGELSKFTMDLS